MDYSKLSDFEINNLVASAQSLLINDNQCASLKVKSSSVLVNDIVSSFEFNPCNNPSDAWPIILDNKIGIQYDYRRARWSALSHKVINGGFSSLNPLRAAMIVYLMIQEDK